MNINDLINKNYKYVVGSSEESKIGENDREYVLSKIEDIIYHNLFDEDFFRNGLTPEQRTKYKSFFENEILSVMMKNVNKTLEQFFTVTQKNEVKWNLPLEKTKAMVKSSFNHKNIPSDVKQSYTMYNKMNEMKITKSQLQEIIREEIQSLTEQQSALINKLIQNIPDHAKNWAKWAAQHANGEWWYYDNHPMKVPGIGWKSLKDDGYQFGSNIKTDSKNWEKSVQKLVREVLSEMEDEELDEITTTGNVAGYNTPNAFKKTDGKDVDDEPDSSYVKRINTGTGYTQVNEDKSKSNRFLGVFPPSKTTFQRIIKSPSKADIQKLIKFSKSNGADVEEYGSSVWASTKESQKIDQMVWSYNGKDLYFVNPKVSSVYDMWIRSNLNENLSEGTNRYHQLHKSEGTPNQKIGVGIRELRKQLSEMEKFVTWYGKIKNESGLDSADYWKRTQRHLTKIRERIDKLSQKIRDLSV